MSHTNFRTSPNLTTTFVRYSDDLERRELCRDGACIGANREASRLLRDMAI